MAKTKELTSEIAYCGPSSKGIFRKYDLRMTYDGERLEYRKNRWVRLEFRKIVNWRVEDASKPYGGEGPIALEQMPKIILQTTGKRGVESRTFAFVPLSFETWLYWIVRAILKHAKIPVPPEYLSKLTYKHRKKIDTRSRMNHFEKTHEVFFNIVDRMKNDFPPGIDGPAKKIQYIGRLKDTYNIDVAQFHGQTNKGVLFSRPKKKLAKAGSGNPVFVFNRLVKPILKKNKTGDGHNLSWKTEPMVAKVGADPGGFGDKKDFAPLEELLKEARVLAALGDHDNIVGLIDCHVFSIDPFRVFMFLEKGEYSLEKHEKSDFEKKITLPMVRKITCGVLSGISHMHQQRLYHMDMKPDQVIICKGNVPKIIDFGLTVGKPLYRNKQEMFESLPMGMFGSVGYVPPEWLPCTNINSLEHLIQRDTYGVGMTILRAVIAPFLKLKGPPKKPSILNRGLEEAHRNAWDTLLEKEATMKQLEAKKVFEIAMMAKAMINKNPAARIPVSDAHAYILDHFKRIGVPLSQIAMGPRSGKPAPKPRTKWKCRNCNRTFNYRPLQCGCHLYVHPDGDPLFVQV